MTGKMRFDISEELRKQWFVFAMLFGVLMAVLNPYYGCKEGPLMTDYSIQYGCVALIYFTAGLKQTQNDFKQCLNSKSLLLFIQVNCFLIIPMVIKSMANILEKFNANMWILKGLLTLSCSPPPLWSVIAMLRLSKQAETHAILNTLLVNFTGTIFTPILMIYLCGSTVMASPYKILTHICLAAIVPLALGMFVNYRYPTMVFRKLHVTSEMIPLVIVYCSICDCIYETQHMIHDGIYAIDGIIQVQLFTVVTFGLSWLMAKALLPEKFVYTAIYCASHKDMVLDIHQMSLLWGWSGAVRCAVTCRAALPTALLPASLLAGYNRKETTDSHIPLG